MIKLPSKTIPNRAKKNTEMKVSKCVVRGKAKDLLSIRFELQELTSFTGLAVFGRLFAASALKE